MAFHFKFTKPMTGTLKKSLFLVLIAFISTQTQAQHYTTTGDFDRISKATLGFGLNTYIGELRQLSDTRLQAGLSTSLAYEHLVTSKIAIRGSLSLYTIKADDALSPRSEDQQRNLSFKSNNTEFAVQALYYRFRHPHTGYKYRAFANPYFHLGIGITTNRPTATLAGKQYKLRPLRTEGKDYGSLALIIPLGAGVSILVTRYIDLQLELQYTLALTGYLDDVSANYPDPASFNNPIAAKLSDRRPELKLAPATAGSARGSGGKDAYFRFGFRLGYYLPKSLYGKSSINCKRTKKTR